MADVAPSVPTGQKHSLRVALMQKVQVLPKWAQITLAVLVVLVIVIIAVAVFNMFAGRGKAGFLPANGHTGGNNPAWWLGSQHAGHGGSVDRNQSPYETRAYGASTDDPHDMAGLGGAQPCGQQSYHAADEADALRSAQGLGDDSLASLMHGGE